MRKTCTCLAALGWIFIFVAAISRADEPDPFAPGNNPSKNDPFGDANEAKPAADPFGDSVDPFAADASNAKPKKDKPAAPDEQREKTPARDESSIERVLNEQTDLEFVEVPLQEVADYLGHRHRLDVALDTRAMDDEGIGADVPVSINVRGISLRSGLRLMLVPLDMTFIVRDGALTLTTNTAAEEHQTARVYPVADLAVVKDAESGEVSHDFDSLIELITTQLEPDTWDEVGGWGSVSAFGNTLIVSQADEVHEQVLQLLYGLRTVRKQLADDKARLSTVALSTGSASIEEKLRLPVTVEFAEVPLVDAVEFLADQLSVPIVIDERALEEVGLATDAPVSLRTTELAAPALLRRMLRPLDLTWIIRDEVVQITTKEVAEGALSTRLYPVYDLVSEDEHLLRDPDTLIEIIETCVEVDSWDVVGGAASICYWSRPATLVISQTEESHGKVAKLLNELRKVQATQAIDPDAGTVSTIPTQLKVQVYHLPRDEKGELTLDAEKVASFLNHTLVASVGFLDGTNRIEVVGPGVIATRLSPRAHAEVEKTITRLGGWVSLLPNTMGGGSFGGEISVGPGGMF